MQRTLEFRRHQEWKHKREAYLRLKQWTIRVDAYENPAIVGRFSTTPQACSCSWCGCGNISRKYSGDSRKENMNTQNALDSLEELGYNEKYIKKFNKRYEFGRW